MMPHMREYLQRRGSTFPGARANKRRSAAVIWRRPPFWSLPKMTNSPTARGDSSNAIQAFAKTRGEILRHQRSARYGPQDACNRARLLTRAGWVRPQPRIRSEVTKGSTGNARYKMSLCDHATRQCHFCDELARQGAWCVGCCHFHQRPSLRSKSEYFPQWSCLFP